MTCIIVAGILVIAALIGGTVFGRKYEQKVLAKSLAEFSVLDQEARGLVHRAWEHLGEGIKAELTKLLRR